MAMALIGGLTESGKSLAAKMLVKEYREHGIKSGVFDPNCSRDWHADFQTDDRALMLEKFWGSTNCAWFFDEAPDVVTNWDLEVKQTATKGRHFVKINGVWRGGHSCHYITTSAAGVAKSVRMQCTILFLFATAPEDCKVYAREWNCPKLLEASKFRPGQYFYCKGRFGDVQEKMLPHPWFKKNKPALVEVEK